MTGKCIVCQHRITDKRRQSFCSDACLTVYARGFIRLLERTGRDG